MSSSLTGLVEVTGVGPGSVRVNLVDGYGHGCSGFDLRDLACGKLVLGVLSDIDVTGQLCSSTLIYRVGGDFCVSDDGGILLARVDGRAISWESIVD